MRPNQDLSELRMLLLAVREYIGMSEDTKKLYWPWVSNNPTDKKNANKFLAWVIIDYQIPANKAVENIRKLSEVVLNDPEDLFGSITSMSLGEWNSKWKEYKLHRFPKAHERLWKIGSKICQYYDGDAREIWCGQTATEVYSRFISLGIGEQLSNMALGALVDLQILEGGGDVKADIHVRRVLGRILEGKGFTTAETQKTINYAREIFPENPWHIDRPLFVCGREVCKAKNPRCEECPFQDVCIYKKENV